MSDVDDRLRLLAHWHARRREVDDLLDPLLQHGPAAVERVSARLDDVSEALAAERLAFEAFAAAAELAQVALPRPVGALEALPVDEVAQARARAQATRDAVRGHPHPEIVDVLLHLDQDGRRRGDDPLVPPVVPPVVDLDDARPRLTPVDD